MTQGVALGDDLFGDSRIFLGYHWRVGVHVMFASSPESLYSTTLSLRIYQNRHYPETLVNITETVRCREPEY